MLFCSHRFIIRYDETYLLHLECVVASPITFTRLCIYLLFSDFKEKTKKKKPARCPQTHAHSNTDTCPVVPLASPLSVTQQTPCDCSKVHTACLPVGRIKQILLQLQKVQAAFLNKCTFRADCCLSRCSPVSVCIECLSYVYCVKHHVDEGC